MAASTQLTRIEAKLLLRDPFSLFSGLILPSIVLLALGLFFPGFDEVAEEFGGIRAIDVYTPTMIGLGLAIIGLIMLPSTLSSYRQMGILRRLRTTPVHPSRVLWAQMVVYGAVAVVASAAVLVIALVVFDVHLPEQLLWFLLSFFLALASMFSIGLLIAAVAPTAPAGQAIGFVVFFPVLFLAGLWVPRPVMPEALKTFSDLTPLGAAVQAMADAWAGLTPSAAHLAVMALYTIVCGLLAVRFFRWE